MADNIIQVDIAVLGAGLAGIAAALALKQHGLQVALIGEIIGKGPKVGEFLPASVRRLFQALQLDEPTDILGKENYLQCNTKMSAWGSATWTYQDSLRDPEGGGWHILRHRFEQNLLKIAGDREVNHFQAKLLELSDNGVQYRVRVDGEDGEITFQSPRLIDATGRKSWLVRRMDSPSKRQNRQMAVIGWVNDTANETERATKVKSVENGWWYTAPLPNRQRVIAFHGLAEDVGILCKKPDRFLAQAQRCELDVGLGAATVLSAPLQSCDASLRLSSKVAGKRWLAIGDAALALDPLSSQGMHFALYSAIMASDAICKARQNEATAFEAMQTYCNQVSDVFVANQRTRHMFYNEERRYRSHHYWLDQCASF
ncbi:MAG: NAD(P)/FAD-dependent oxidoreductase [Pikeienuella sp.]